MIATEIARKYIGQTEIPGNMGFTNEEFQKRMEAVGFQKTHAWCAYFAELVFKEAFPQLHMRLDKLFSASTITTYRNFRDAGFPVSTRPKVDDLVIWQNYKDGKPLGTGHAGVVSFADIDGWHFRSIEGNTTGGGGREGFIVAEHNRKVLADVGKGLKVLGFITIRP